MTRDLFLITGHNDSLIYPCATPSYNPISLEKKDFAENIELIQSSSDAVILLGCSEQDDGSAVLGSAALFPDVRIIVCAPSITPALEAQLLQAGSAEFLAASESAALDYLLSCKTAEMSGETVLVFDENTVHTKIIKNILSLFGCELIAAKTLQEFFDIPKQKQCILTLANIGSSGFDILKFIKQSYTESEFKRIPFIPYKGSDEGISLIEVSTGINRLAKCIVSPRELYAFLVNTFFNRELYTQIQKLNTDSQYKGNEFFAEQSFSRIFFDNTPDIFSMEKSLLNAVSSGLLSTAEGLVCIIKKTAAVSWLTHLPEQKTIF